MFEKNLESGVNDYWLLFVNRIDLNRVRLNFDCKFTCLSQTIILSVGCVGFCLGHSPSQNRFFLSHLVFFTDFYVGLCLGSIGDYGDKDVDENTGGKK